MTIGSRVLGALTRLPSPRTTAVSVERDIETKMPDGVVLLADRWYPSANGSSTTDPPVVLIRSPYGRRQIGIVGRLFAERGYQVVIQSCRGTFGSGGAWQPFRNEREDGHATLEWLAAKTWFGGTTATFGPSYLGITQWAVTDDLPAHVAAMAPCVTASNFRDAAIYLGDELALETTLSWVQQVEHQELRPLAVLRAMARSRSDLQPGYAALPLSDADQRVVGRHVDFFQDWLQHDTSDDWWSRVDFEASVPNAAPATLVGGWYDIFLARQVRDYEALASAGRPARLTIGPWSHTSPGALAAMLRDGLEWFDEQIHHRPSKRSQPVRLFVMGSRRWIETASWPPAADPQQWYLHADGRLAPQLPTDSTPDRYRYHPADPTPGVGGASLDRKNSGPKDQHDREARADVLTYTSDALTDPVTVVGPLVMHLHVRPSSPFADYVVRLCDVSPRGKSINLSDGFVRLRGEDPAAAAPDGTLSLQISMWPTANTFHRGHRIRVQISSGAHPLIARNPGTGEPLATASTLVAVDHEVFHDPERPSAIELPISAL